MNRALISLVSLIVIAGIAGSACSRPSFLAPPQGLAVGDDGMYSRPEAQLRFPGSSVITQFSQDEYRGSNPFGGGQSVTLSARVGAHLATRNGFNQVVIWYDSWLAARGWHRVGASLPATWGRGPLEMFVVSSDQIRYATDRLSEVPSSRGTGYYALYYVTPNGCPGQSVCPASALPGGIHY